MRGPFGDSFPPLCVQAKIERLLLTTQKDVGVKLQRGSPDDLEDLGASAARRQAVSTRYLSLIS